MGNETSSFSSKQKKEAFDRLDSDSDNLLTLDQLLSIPTERGIDCLTGKFDEGQDGAIDFQEWQKLLEHIQDVLPRTLTAPHFACAQKRVAKLRKLKRHNKEKVTLSSSSSMLTDSASTTPTYGKVWTSVTRATVGEKFDLSREGETPAFTGRSHQEELETNPKEAEAMAELADIQEDLKHEAKSFLDKITSTPKGRKRVISWLWNLADVDKSNSINLHELMQLLKALRIDGIMAQDLSFVSLRKSKDRDRGNRGSESPQGESERSMAQDLMLQYDVDGDGVLRKSDFKNLANMVISHYRKRNFNKEQKVGDFVLKRVVGTGAFGTVYYAINTVTKEEKAIKVLGKGDVNDMSRVDTEIKAMMMLQHRNVAHLEGVLEGQDYVFFTMELCGGGTLSNFMQGRPLSEDIARYFFIQIVKGTAYSHAAGVCHRCDDFYATGMNIDLKLDNILLSNDATVKITDFGHAGVYQTGWDIFSTPLVGGLTHVAPEQIKGVPYSGEKNDIWSLGIILYTMLYAEPPFKGGTPQEMFDQILNNKYQFPTKKAITSLGVLVLLDSR